MDEVEQLRQKRMQELQQQAMAQENQQRMVQELEMQKRQAMTQILTPEARSRLANLRLAKPEFVDQIEIQLIQLVQSGQVRNQITDDQLKDLLKRLTAPKRKTNITRK
ncbi:MAG: DNA-binding protein [Methanobrevibacter sp.]|jgi:programmed cell death protein 5|nr:DNA-binding protein [Candidatus Methanoflexus mossambicus]